MQPCRVAEQWTDDPLGGSVANGKKEGRTHRRTQPSRLRTLHCTVTTGEGSLPSRSLLRLSGAPVLVGLPQGYKTEDKVLFFRRVHACHAHQAIYKSGGTFTGDAREQKGAVHVRTGFFPCDLSRHTSGSAFTPGGLSWWDTQGLSCYVCYGAPHLGSCKVETCPYQDAVCAKQEVMVIRESEEYRAHNKFCLPSCVENDLSLQNTQIEDLKVNS
ncbi:uncharacterized protein LOC111822632 [Trichechus manatus latirostris]|uniref:Uncharacterized protein LOC111822632 n=1 Tax=Trichechus manatus latirostris TaxID=127582 RepID=A0A2Y9RUW6_TRIMA|nr:uncharacterized protein LOC111822632 [Trichechus manatus latirostris]